MAPCTYLHPRGIAVPAIRQASGTLTMLLVRREVGGDAVTSSKNTGKSKEEVGTEACSPVATTVADQDVAAVIDDDRTTSGETRSDRHPFLEEVSSLDNLKYILHRTRTFKLRRETLQKLVELGSVLDFAELARKKKVAERKKKWRDRMSRYKICVPSLPKSSRRNKGKNAEAVVSSKKDSAGKNSHKEIPFHDHIAAISWGDLLQDASVQTERMCAIFRRRADLLDGLTFETEEYKAQVMVDLRNNGVSLAATHAEWDECIQMGRTVALTKSWFERGSWGCFERSAVVGRRCVALLFQMHQRLEISHERMEKSYRSADARLTEGQLSRLARPPAAGKTTDAERGSGGMDSKNEKIGAEGGDGDNAGLVCCICHCDIDEEDGDEEASPALYLPCSHCFHGACIREWLHNHSQCPVCRFDLNSTL